MTNITREELLYLAAMSKIELSEEEILILQNQLKDLISYAECVADCAEQVQKSTKLVNVWREDNIKESKPEEILSLAPQRDDNYFVVPKVLDK